MTKYAAAIIQLAIVLAGALAQLTGTITLVTALQLIVLLANAVVVYLVPLFGTQMRSGWKTGVAILGAIIAAGIPYATTHHITGPQVALVVLAGLQALGAHIGVQIRNDAALAPAFQVTTVGVATPTAPAASEPPTDTTMTKAVAATGGEFIGDAAR